MIVTTKTLIPYTVWGTASDNYDGTSMVFDGTPIEASSHYFSVAGGLQTVWLATENFVGSIAIQATLMREPLESDWATIYTSGDAQTPLSETQTTNVTGNFVWMRAKVSEFQAGTITEARLSYI